MNKQLRDRLGQALYESELLQKTVFMQQVSPTWEQLAEQSKEPRRKHAEAVYRTLLRILQPGYLMMTTWSNDTEITEEEFKRLFGMAIEEATP